MRAKALHFVSLVAVFGTVLVVAALLVSGGAADEHANVSLYTTEDGDLDDAAAIEDAIENGTLKPGNDTFYGEDTLVVALESADLARDLDARNGTASERFFAALDDNLTFSLVQTNPSPQRQPINLPVGPANTTVHRNGTTTFLSIDTTNVSLGWLGGSTTEPEIYGGETFAVRFGHDVDDSSVNYTTVGPETEFQLTGAAFAATGMSNPVAPEVVNTTIDIYTEPDDAIQVRLTLDDGTELNETITADTSSTPTFSYDFGNVEPGTTYTFQLLFDGEVVDERTGTVRALEASLREPEVSTVEDEPYLGVLNLSVDLSHGGFIEVYDETGQEVSRLSVGARDDLTLPLPIHGELTADFDPDELHVQAVRQTTDGTEPYPNSDANLTLDVSDIDWTATPTPTSTPTTTPTPASAGTPTPDGTPTATSMAADDDGSGFTPVVAVLALLAVVLAGCRRRR